MINIDYDILKQLGYAVAVFIAFFLIVSKSSTRSKKKELKEILWSVAHREDFGRIKYLIVKSKWNNLDHNEVDTIIEKYNGLYKNKGRSERSI